MDRIKLCLIVISVGVGAVVWPLGAAADTVLLPSSPPVVEDREAYPESRFGSPPPRVDVGLGPSYVRHAVSELDPIRDEIGDRIDPRAGGRSPAGVEFTTDKTSRRARETLAKAPAPQPRFVSTDTTNPEPGSNPIVRSGVQEVAVIASDLGYFPRTLFVVRDMPVRLYVTGASRNTLCIMMDSFQVRKQVRSQKIEEIAFTPAHPGKFRFYCPVNGMEGTLIVKEYSTGIAETAEAPASEEAPPRQTVRAPAAVEEEIVPTQQHSHVTPSN